MSQLPSHQLPTLTAGYCDPARLEIDVEHQRRVRLAILIKSQPGAAPAVQGPVENKIQPVQIRKFVADYLALDERAEFLPYFLHRQSIPDSRPVCLVVDKYAHISNVTLVARPTVSDIVP